MKKVIISSLIGALLGAAVVFSINQSNFSQQNPIVENTTKSETSNSSKLSESLKQSEQLKTFEQKTQTQLDYQNILTGKRLFLDLSQYSEENKGEKVADEEESCAGFTFLDDAKTVLFHNEIDPLCSDEIADKMRIQWIDNNAFILTDKYNNNKQNCPPRNYMYKIISINNKQAIFEEIWTGWGEYPNQKIIYTIKDRE